MHSVSTPLRIVKGYSHMEEGNQSWNEGRYEDALHHWTTAIEVTSIEDDLLKVLYSNRSAAYSK